MPRVLPAIETAKYHNLRTLLQWDRTKAKEAIMQLQDDSKQIVSDIEEEMVRLHGFKWKVQWQMLPLGPSRLLTGLPVDMARISCSPQYGSSPYAHHFLRPMLALSEEQEALQLIPPKGWILPSFR